MTVGDLIAYLSALPVDATVVDGCGCALTPPVLTGDNVILDSDPPEYDGANYN